MTAASRMLYVNLCVRDLPKAKQFFAALGFTFNPQFTDDNAACMVVSQDAFVMLLTPPFFKGFTRKVVCDTATHTEGLFAFSCSSREEVDALVATALAHGGTPAMDKQDLGFMYSWSFYDLDGHHWELGYMDPAHLKG